MVLAAVWLGIAMVDQDPTALTNSLVCIGISVLYDNKEKQ